MRPIVRAPALEIGTLYHVALAYHYAELLAEKPPWYVYSDPWTAVRVCGADRPDLATEALRLFDAYVARFPRDADPWRPVLVEHQFWSSAEGRPYSTRIDLLAWEDGVGYVLSNHKTAARKGSAVNYATDLQVLTEVAQARAAGYDVRRYYINECVKSDPPLPHRFEVSVSPAMYARLAQDTGYYLRERDRVIAEFPDPWNRPRNHGACRGRYRLCDFWGLCWDGLARLNEYVVEEARAAGSARPTLQEETR